MTNNSNWEFADDMMMVLATIQVKEVGVEINDQER
eukprot:CAMPEP_0202474494 /NCGR_PEP_ID=MMETSP1360-20130828/92414_1 /ASSEMBLY_ACC=CAM_ASM_000848 /TAXON_ID=515479 /ORGANISM="Licmophora paradoxa, Strain CCMP2313" /LENGTH=34 /DNA_ID= /DNA_START= /DNA_END= /DNA_ORIENTATION=